MAENDLSVSLTADSSPERGAKRNEARGSLGSPFRGAVTRSVTERSSHNPDKTLFIPAEKRLSIHETAARGHVRGRLLGLCLGFLGLFDLFGFLGFLRGLDGLGSLVLLIHEGEKLGLVDLFLLDQQSGQAVELVDVVA